LRRAQINSPVDISSTKAAEITTLISAEGVPRQLPS
jgi:hypothetical protein